MSVNLIAFGQTYPLPTDLIPEFILLEKAFSGSYRELSNAEIDLNLDRSFKPAFDWIYQRLIDRTPWAQTRPIPVQFISDIYQLADYLGIEQILDEIRSYVLSSVIPQGDLILLYPRLEPYPALKNAVIFHIVSTNTFYDNLPTWAKEDLNLQQAWGFPQSTFVYTRVIPVQNPQLYSGVPLNQLGYVPDFARRAQYQRQPSIVYPNALNLLGPWQTLASQIVNGVSYLMTCPRQDLPFIGGLKDPRGAPPRGPGELPPVCYQNPHEAAPDIEILRNPQIQGKVPYDTPAGFTVYMDPGFQGDYIFSNSFQALPKFNAIVV